MPRVHRQGAESAEAAEFFVGVHGEALCNKIPDAFLLAIFALLASWRFFRSPHCDAEGYDDPRVTRDHPSQPGFRRGLGEFRRACR